MTWSLFAGLIVFSAVSAFTPGPNNLLALASGVNHGYKRTLPFVLGVCLGFNVIFIFVGIGLGNLFQVFPLAYAVLKYASMAYLVFLAGKVAFSKGFGEGRGAAKPISFLGSATYQWINPKAWIATVTIVTSFTNPQAFWLSMAIAVGVNAFFAFSSVSAWALFGSVVKSWLSNPLRLRLFNWSMATLLVLSIVPAFFHD
jgi:threonine/homoserine/homoserine lactone efflux protein